MFRPKKYCDKHLSDVMSRDLIPELSTIAQLSKLPEAEENHFEHFREKYPQGEIPHNHKNYFQGASKPMKDNYETLLEEIRTILYVPTSH